MPRLRTLPLEIVRDHALVRLGRAAALIDTGSPLTMRAPKMVEQQLGQSIRWLVGNDVIRRRRILLDWPGRRVVIDGPPLAGEEIELVPHGGVYQIEVKGPHGPVLAIVDSGAWLSYCPPSAVAGKEPVAFQRDFSPYVGEYEVPVYELTVRVGTRRIQGRFGLLPAPLSEMLSLIGGTGWIIGATLFKDRSIQLDLGRNRLVDTTSPPPRVTLPVSTPQRAPRELSKGIEAWRGWRLDDIAGSPKLRSLSASDLWNGPVFGSNAIPTLGDRQGVGVHAYRTPMGMNSLRSSSAIVYGRVTLFGQVCIHELGYRAERVRIDRLYLRACAYHSNSDSRARRRGPLLLQLLEEQNDPRGSYCGCDTLPRDSWLTYRELERLADKLGDKYQCDVTIDPERARDSYGRGHEWQRPNIYEGGR